MPGKRSEAAQARTMTLLTLIIPMAATNPLVPRASEPQPVPVD
jgi:hypothetical protein